MRGSRLATRLGVLILVGATLSGCASVQRYLAKLSPEPSFKVRAAISAPVAAPNRVDRLYDAAARDLQARNYGRALETLQLAREQAPDDVRILNALGVTYDKLGRFDLSNRYYVLALRSEPESPIILSNLRYSARLQHASEAEVAMTVPAPSVEAPAPVIATLSPPTFTPPAPPPAFRIARGSIAAIRPTPLFVGGPVVIVDGSGTANSADQTRAALRAKGWSVAPQMILARAAPAQGQIRYPPGHAAAAQALARTLPFPLTLSACTEPCLGLRLTLGTNSKWIS